MWSKRFMILSKNKTISILILDKIAKIITTGLSIGYPFVLYIYGPHWQSSLLLGTILTLMSLRALSPLLQNKPLTSYQQNFLLFMGTLGMGLLIGYIIDKSLMPYLYPVMVSFSMGTVFVKSLISPPSLIEQLARLHEPLLDEQGIIYTHKVTILWAIYCFSNGLISGAIALWGSHTTWALYNGVISYVIMGILFAGEFGVRRWVRSRSLLTQE